MLEAEVSRVTGVSRTTLKKLRQGLQAGVHFVDGSAGVAFTADGLMALRGIGVEVPDKKPVAGLEVEDGAEGGLAPETAVAGLPASETGKKMARVRRANFINTRVMECELDEGPVVRVRVRDSQLFVKGQQVPVVPAGDGSPMWLLACRHPRVRGRINW